MGFLQTYLDLSRTLYCYFPGIEMRNLSDKWEKYSYTQTCLTCTSDMNFWFLDDFSWFRVNGLSVDMTLANFCLKSGHENNCTVIVGLS